MDIGVITNLVANLGFPVFAIMACGWFIWHVVKAYRDDFNKQLEQIQSTYAAREEKMFLRLDKFDDTMDKFNETLIKIDKRLEALESKIH